MRIEELKYDSFVDLFHQILPTGKLGQSLANSSLGRMLYRGVSSAKYELIPSALRLGSQKLLLPEYDFGDAESAGHQIRCEHYKLTQFYTLANEQGLKINSYGAFMRNPMGKMASSFDAQKTKYKWLSDEYEELAALAQHYGIPTRLLDWTSDLFTAMYFASSGALNKWKDKDYDRSDNMLIWILAGGLVQGLEREIPLKLVVPPYHDNPNLDAQKGVLTYWQVEMPSKKEEERRGLCSFPIDRRPLDQLLREHDLASELNHLVILYKIRLNINECGKMYSTMNQLGYNAAKLFPGYEGIIKKNPYLQGGAKLQLQFSV